MTEQRAVGGTAVGAEMQGFKHAEYDNVEPTPEALLLCAKICHAVTKAHNDVRGEITLDFGLIKAGLIHAIQDIIEDPTLTGKRLHEMWMADKLARGWVHGPVKDAVKKTHPCIVGYDELPAEQRVKDDVVLAVTREMFPCQ